MVLEIPESAIPKNQAMPIRNEDWAKIKAEIRTEIEEYLSPHGWRKAYRVLREMAPLGGVITVVLALVAIIVTLAIGVTNRREADAKFQGATTQKLQDIEAELRNLHASQSLNEISNLPPKQFVQSLPALQTVTKMPVSDVKPTSATIQLIAEKLRNTDENSPDYWPNVLQFIKFASSGLSPDVPPPGPPTLEVDHNVGLPLGNLSHVRLLLVGGEIVNSRIKNSRVTFTNAPVRMRNVVFVDCVFELPITPSPNPFLQDAAKQLLASNLQLVTVPSL